MVDNAQIEKALKLLRTPFPWQRQTTVSVIEWQLRCDVADLLENAIYQVGEPGQRSYLSHQRTKARNEHIQLAFQALQNQFPAETGHAISEKLSDAVRDFESRKWPHHKSESDPPAHFSLVDRELFLAFKAKDTSFPHSPRRLRDISEI